MYVWALVSHSLRHLIYRSGMTDDNEEDEEEDGGSHCCVTSTARFNVSEALHTYDFWCAPSVLLPTSHACLRKNCVLASVANFLNIWIDMKRCSFHLMPVYVMVRAPQNAKHRKNCKFLSLFMSFFLSLVTVKHILMTMALRTICPILKGSVWKSCCMVQHLPVGRGRVSLAGDIVTRPSGLHQKERYSFCHSPRGRGSKWHHSFPEVASFYSSFFSGTSSLNFRTAEWTALPGTPQCFSSSFLVVIMFLS